MTTDTAERELFEAWFLREKKGTLPDLHMEGEWYYWSNTAKLWDAWSAARATLSAQPTTPAPGPVAAEQGLESHQRKTP